MANQSNSIWTDARIAELKRLWETGRSGPEIARELGGGFTKNSICNKIRRLRLADPNIKRRHDFSEPRKARTEARRRKAVVIPVKPKAPPAPVPPPQNAPVRLADIDPHQCRYIKDKPKGSGPYTLYCGAPAEGDWCRYHMTIVYEPRQPKPKQAEAA